MRMPERERCTHTDFVHGAVIVGEFAAYQDLQYQHQQAISQPFDDAQIAPWGFLSWILVPTPRPTVATNPSLAGFNSQLMWL